MPSLAICTAPILILILTTFLLCPDSATSSQRFLDHVQSSNTSFTSMKTLLRSYRFLLRSYYVLQVLTASIQFFKDVGRTWHSVKSVLLRQSNFSTRLSTIEPPFNIATQSRYLDRYSLCKTLGTKMALMQTTLVLLPRQKQYWYFISLLRFSALKCKPNGQKNVVVLENLIIESLHMIETEL